MADTIPNPEASPDPAAAKRRRLLVAVLVLAAVGLLLFALFRAVPVLDAGVRLPPEPERDFTRLVCPGFPLDQGTVLLLVVATDCEHCREHTRQVVRFGLEKRGISILLLIFGDQKEADLFLAETGVELPHRLADQQEYMDFSGDDPTTVFLLENGKLRKKWEGRHFNQSALFAELERRD